MSATRHALAFLFALSIPSTAPAAGGRPAPEQAGGGPPIAFPLVPTGERGALGAIELAPVPSEILALREHGALRMTDVPLPGGPVALELVRVPLDRSAHVYVDGELVSGGLDRGDLSVWTGSVVGDENLRAMLGFSLAGCHGWIDTPEGRFELLSSPGEGGDWTRARARLVPAAAVESLGGDGPPRCATDTSSFDGTIAAPRMPARAQLGIGPNTLECPIAIETDYQLYQVFGDLAAEQNYVAFLLAALSDRFLEQVDVVFTYPYIAFYTNPNDPWTSQDNGGGCGDVLNEFQSAWAGNLPNGAALGHFLSGASLGCGVAWVGVVCNPTWGFSLSCCINGGVTFPVQQGSNTWDFFVAAHEIGHNFGSGHTHDYCPPLDRCADNCTGVNECTSQGTNLSYCHGCPGGMNNITTYYHPTVVGVMRQHAESTCLGSACAPDVATYCTAAANSAYTGGARISWWGTTSITDNDFHLTVTGAVPMQFGLFYYGPNAIQVPFGDGFRCVGGGLVGLFRLSPAQTPDLLGDADRWVDFGAPPADAGYGQIAGFTQWNFQFWYRDPAAGLSGFNLSDALTVTFCP